MKKILVIDESELFRNYLKQKLEEFGFEVILGKSGFDGMVRMRNSLPDLVIMDYHLSQTGSVKFLQEKKADPNSAGIPVIMTASKIDKDQLLKIAQYKIRKFFSKPIKIDALLKTISEILGVFLNVDATPCIIEVHFNDDILFIEVARGLNREKIELLKYKIDELLQLYKVASPKVLVMMSDVELTINDEDKLEALLANIVDHTHTRMRNIKILTRAEFVRSFVEKHQRFQRIEVIDSLDKAMDSLLGLNYMDKDKEFVQEKILTGANKEHEQPIQFRFQQEETTDVKSPFTSEDLEKQVTIAVVDDDIVIQELVKTAFAHTGWAVQAFDNGREFVSGTDAKGLDLVFLDLMMPEMDGFQVMQHMKQHGVDTPIIILSALTQRETVEKALRYDIKSYLIKPLKPEQVLVKSAEVLKMNF
jgi:DNA-binding response OmpR family regulator